MTPLQLFPVSPGFPSTASPHGRSPQGRSRHHLPSGRFPPCPSPSGLFLPPCSPSGPFPSGLFLPPCSPSGPFPSGRFLPPCSPSGRFPSSPSPSGPFPSGRLPPRCSADSVLGSRRASARARGGCGVRGQTTAKSRGAPGHGAGRNPPGVWQGQSPVTAQGELGGEQSPIGAQQGTAAGTRPCHPFVGLRPTQQGRARVGPARGAPTLEKSPEQPSGEQWESHSHGELSHSASEPISAAPQAAVPTQVSPRWDPRVPALTSLPVPRSRRRRDARPLAGCRVPLQQRCCPPRHPQPNENPTEEPEAARDDCEEESEEEVLDLAESEETDSEAPAQGEFPYRALQEYPINNMVTGYASARDMKKYEGELHDFIPGTSGYAAYWVQSKCSIYCEKTKMKRKW
ncbi:telomere repeats-binding bouquet formation protein 2 isoform X2 [Passer montanus]|uniref:telomere repeats-binding bouquet formation protein 2 isoform X2 n=1 Tax=Passer montanus TaxID=9160 RepID=UPI00195F528E|nr:telomere repeats-binding bouquet formation protein 2 isoform X2 [Passer montanus]